ncbi:diguanylate cyclase domain-containing protein [Micromonosporaceae bacterium Da 78-11]
MSTRPRWWTGPLPASTAAQHSADPDDGVGIRLWWSWLAGATLICVGYPFLPADSLAATGVYNGVGLLSALMIPIGVRRNRPTNPRAWYVFTGGVVAFVVGDVIYEVTGLVFGHHPYPYWDDAVYFTAYPMLWAGLLLSVRGRGRRDLASLIDAAVITTGVGLVYWVFVIGPALADRGSPLFERIVTVGYPTCDVLMCAVLTRLLTRDGMRTASVLQLAGGAGLTFACDEAVAVGSAQVCLLDLNGFKVINDRLGHAVGDRLLVSVAERLTGALRDVDLVARMGGDEFAILFADSTADEGDRIVDRLSGALRRPIEVGGQELLIGASIGIADTTDTLDPVEVLRRADVAMYAAKAAGSRFRRYAVELDDQAGEEARLGAEMRAALDLGEFRLVYQPIVSLPDGRTRYVESLVRWQHPVRGFVSPVDFIPVAEQNGLIVELGEWILRTACAKFMGRQAGTR